MGDPASRQVFVYGSLLSAASLQRTLPNVSFADGCTPFVLAGWERAWNVVSARTFALADDPAGVVHRRLVLGLQPSPAGRCEGVLLLLHDDDVALLDAREAAYELAAVGVDHDGAPVWSYVPRRHRTTAGDHSIEPRVVEKAYLDEYRTGLAHHGFAASEAELVTSLAGLRVASAAI